MLKNTLYRLMRDKRLTVGYFGGSITEGAGASGESRCWRALTTAWFRARYPDCEIIEIQAAVGGTGTELGVFRCDRDLTSGKPDLVFMEFSINDSGKDVIGTMANTEAILHKIYAANPCAEIVCVHTTSRDHAERIAGGGVYSSRAAHVVLMEYYGIPQLDIGEILRARVTGDGGDWTAVLRDSVHPNDAGYAIYAGAVISFLERELRGNAGEALLPVSLPPFLSRDDRRKARLENACGAAGEAAGWTRRPESLCGRYDDYIEACRPGAEITYRFTGSGIGLYFMMAEDSGDLYYRVDGGEELKLRTWDGFCRRFRRAYGQILTAGLAEGEHSIHIRVSEEKAEESLGTAIRIGAFMVW